MSWSRRELVALIVLIMLHLVAAGSDGNASGSVSGSVTSLEQQLELKLSALRVHRQLLQSEIARLYMENFRPETPLLLEELQQRQQEVQLQIETLEGKAQHEQDAQQLAIHLAADFEYLQHKLDELKQQLQQLDATMLQANNHTAPKLPPGEAQRDDTPTTPTAVSSYFWTPLLAMPEFPSGSIAQSAAASNATPSLIKRLLAMLRPSASSSTSTSTSSSASLSFLRGQSSKPKQKVQLLSAEELLPQLQLQRQFLDDAITRLEQLAAGKKSDKNP